MKDVEIPQMIDNFPQVMWFEADELVPVLVGGMAGSVFNAFTPALCAGIALSWIYIRHKRTALPGSLHHLTYWWGLLQLNMDFTNGLDRESEA